MAVRTPIKLMRVALIADTQVAPRRGMLAGVARYIHEHSPWSIYLKPFGVEKSLENWIREWNGDGIIASTIDFDSSGITDVGIPIVDLVGFLRRPGVPLVHTNDFSVGRLGAEHLLERGFGNFGFIQHPESWSNDRRKAFEATVRARGFNCSIYTMPHSAKATAGPHSWEKQQSELVTWIQSLTKPVAVMTSTDLGGQQFLEACQRAHMVVPEEVAVIGVDNDELICNVAFPPLSSVIINDHQRGYEAAAVLDRMMQGFPPPTETVYVEPAGVVSRASTDILAINDDLLSTALRFVRENACNGIGVDEVVKSVPLSRSVLERRFRNMVGRTINDEIVRVRLNRAVELLASTELELKAIAQKVGFCSPSYMGAVFRDKLGRTPGSYRTAARNPRGQVVQSAIAERQS